MKQSDMPSSGVLAGTVLHGVKGRFDVYLRNRGSNGIGVELRYVALDRNGDGRTGATLTVPGALSAEIGRTLVDAQRQADEILGGANAAAQK